MSPSPLRSSPLEPAHEAAGASFTDFAGYRMPVRYSSDLAEHHAVRDAAVVRACAQPSGGRYGTRGLLALGADTSEVEAVLAHEIANVTLRHATARSEMALRAKLVSRVVAGVLNDPATGAQIESQSKVTLDRKSTR